MEETGWEPRLAHTFEAKKRMLGRDRTDHLDAKGFQPFRKTASTSDVRGHSLAFPNLERSAARTGSYTQIAV